MELGVQQDTYQNGKKCHDYFQEKHKPAEEIIHTETK